MHTALGVARECIGAPLGLEALEDGLDRQNLDLFDGGAARAS
jgi:hypothetical protein